MTTEVVVADILFNLNRCENLFPYLSGTRGACFNGPVNHLLCTSQGELSFYSVSDYAATELSKKLGPSIISNLRSVLQKWMNPSMDGQLLEMRFFAKVEQDDLTFLWKWAQRKFWWMNRWSRGAWPLSIFIDFDPERSLPPI